MSSDNTKNSVNKKYNTRSAGVKSSPKAVSTIKTEPLVKEHESSSSSDDDEDVDNDEDDEEDEEDEDDEEETDEDYIASADEMDEELSDKEYKKFLSELFPSSYMKEKVAAVEALTTPPSKHKKSSNAKCPPAPKKSKHNKYAAVEEDSETLDDTDESEGTTDDDDDDSDYEEEKNDNKQNSKNPMKNFNISFIINDQKHDGGGDFLSPTEALYDEAYSDSEDEVVEKKASKTPKEPEPSFSDEIAAFAKMKSLFESLSPELQQNPVMKKMIYDIKEKEKRFLKKEELKSKKKKVENTKKLKTLLRERDVMNDLQYFNEKMTVAEQESALLQIEEIKKHNDITKPYRLTLLDADIPSQFKAIAYRKISSLRSMEPGGGDYYKMKNWVDTFMQIPFGKYRNLPITITDGVEKCHEFMDNAKQILDQAVYGLNDAKLQIMQMVGQWIVNPSAIGTAIAIKGPMGTGKTTLVKEGISKILGRDFVFIALGGATDSSFLEGHSYTYEGSTWGKIVDLLIKCKSMNPVIYFDELDKISDTPKGEEIAGILTHLTDTAQNNQFHDRYFSEIEFDLSRCLFIFSYNDESKVNKILLDRMYRIQTQGYNQAQKTTISNKYLLPKICDQVKFAATDINISEETLHYIITNYTDKEDGVRTLKRCLEIIYTKLNLYRLMRPDTNIFESEMSIKVEFPMQVTTAIVDKLIKKKVDNGGWHDMYM
jgi:ATP-dependent Lon protease